MKLNDTTKRYPRTLSEAFGPAATGPVQAADDEPLFDRNDRIVLWGVGLAAVAVFVLCLIEVLQ